MSQACSLRLGAAHLEDSVRHTSMAAAKQSFLDTAKELDRYGQKVEASIYLISRHQRVPLTEYPDYVLSLGPKGGLVCERA